MILSRDEAVCVVLGMAENNEINSTTKLNKLLARLNLFLIPIDIDFSLNKYGSFNAELDSLESCKYFSIETYRYKDNDVKKYKITNHGTELFKETKNKKLNKILTEEEYSQITEEIRELSKLRASDISGDEHKILLVDIETRYKLIGKINEVLVELFDLKDIHIPEDAIANIRLKAIIEYCYYVTLYLKKKFEKIEENYDYEAYMFDYYFLYHIGNLIPFVKKQLRGEKDVHMINRYYHYLIYSVKDRYPFSIDNPDLNKLIAE
ncbi:TPA: hypothetical protein HA235_01820 [Candidatus Woesearchaeota archaeon]|nr:hypothetical protein [Candidatus Woesearchaeota archaeon]HIH31422.1 hypothetical protein [Candidatus Woesearchaeota archaeon]HIH55317.1 hypothetical protein [Candidatus Woesearchaeota archaeon]HIJ01294.1 hypothetical protein [Candidatus Woesearchaeota archaeon]HIJ13700.1 hypothetical protein [Candidatus Woesearchaeota archaeon]